METTDKKRGRPAGTKRGEKLQFAIKLDADVVEWVNNTAKSEGDTASGFVRRLIYSERARRASAPD